LFKGEPLLSEGHWTVAEKIIEVLGIFYDSTVTLSGVCYPTSLLMLHHIIDSAGHLHAQESDTFLMSIVTRTYRFCISLYLFWILEPR
jgi:hypothetical protein